tara:strand:- start:10138 stop:10365 length:228 start_codon:yes stop_codon:yes gene_type:complete
MSKIAVAVIGFLLGMVGSLCSYILWSKGKRREEEEFEPETSKAENFRRELNEKLSSTKKTEEEIIADFFNKKIDE